MTVVFCGSQRRQVVNEVKAKKLETMKAIKRLQAQKEQMTKKHKMAKIEYDKVLSACKRAFFRPNCCLIHPATVFVATPIELCIEPQRNSRLRVSDTHPWQCSSREHVFGEADPLFKRPSPRQETFPFRIALPTNSAWAAREKHKAVCG